MTEEKEKLESPSHFAGKDALSHVVEKQSLGRLASAEGHAVEMPDHFAAATDTMRDMALALLLFWVVLVHVGVSFSVLLTSLLVLGVSWLTWRVGRSALLGWQHLERLHRVMEEERWEIEHHRPQERAELAELYRAKGFEGQLLEDVLDVLMADGDRLLKVMLEEELGLSLASHEHPLKQSAGALVGGLVSICICAAAVFFLPAHGVLIAALGLMVFAGASAANYERNAVIPSMVWNLGLGAVTFGMTTFLLNYLLR